MVLTKIQKKIQYSSQVAAPKFENLARTFSDFSTKVGAIEVFLNAQEKKVLNYLIKGLRIVKAPWS